MGGKEISDGKGDYVSETIPLGAALCVEGVGVVEGGVDG